jgi:hypothetical protein
MPAKPGGQPVPCSQVGKSPPPDNSDQKYYFTDAIFFLTVINVLLYSKYPMALDGYVRTVGKRLSGGL